MFNRMVVNVSNICIYNMHIQYMYIYIYIYIYIYMCVCVSVSVFAKCFNVGR